MTDIVERLKTLRTVYSGSPLVTPPLTDAIAEITTLRARVAELEGVVGGLHRTADGVPIVFGMTVWFFYEDYQCQRLLVSGTVCGIYSTHFDYKGEVTIGVQSDYDWEGGNLEVWSTREAALAAKEARDE